MQMVEQNSLENVRSLMQQIQAAVNEERPDDRDGGGDLIFDINMLVANTFEVNAHRRTALHAVCQGKSNSQIWHLLIEHKANPLIEDSFGASALSQWVSHSHRILHFTSLDLLHALTAVYFNV